jgi:Cys-rich repeat protein
VKQLFSSWRYPSVLPARTPLKRPLSSVRIFAGLVLLVCAVGCGHEKFNLLPAPVESGDEGMAGDATMPGGRAGGGAGGRGGAGGFPSGGRPMHDGGPLPEPDCPDGFDPCVPCSSDWDCTLGTVCDTWRNYCAPYCGPVPEGNEIRCSNPLVCDAPRSLCVECIYDTHCGTGNRCDKTMCVPRPEAECSDNTHCANPEPICIYGVCRPCSADHQCGVDMHCENPRCVPKSMRQF